METMIGINRAILHILDFNSNLTVFSERELELGSGSAACWFGCRLFGGGRRAALILLAVLSLIESAALLALHWFG